MKRLEKNININVVTVTYGNRIHLLKNLVASLSTFSNYLNYLIVIHNNSECDLVESDLLFPKSQLIQIRNLTNEGSAAGFKKGLIHSESKGADFTVLIDDDNIFIENSFYILSNYLNSKLYDNWSIISFYRITRKKYLDLVEKKSKNVIIKSNKFLGIGFSYCNNSLFDDNIQFLPYSGLVIPSLTIRKKILPDEKFFLYQDDRDYTFKLYKAGFKFIILSDIKIEDQDESWGNDLNFIERLLPSIIRKKSNEFKVFHSVKSRILFELRHNVKNEFFYRCNLIIFIIIISILIFIFYPVSGKFNRLQTIFKAIKLGFILNEK